MNKGKLSLYIVGVLLLSRTLAIAQFAEPYRVNGSADLNMAACSPEGPVGKVSATFWVLRRYDVKGPTQIEIKNLPPDVTVTLSPATLTYPGYVTGQQVTATFTVNAGVQIPDVVVQIEAKDLTNKVSYDLLLHGTCARHNRDFTIRGSFTSVQMGTAFPVEGALVEIYRDVPWQLDQFVGSTITGRDGSFDKKLWADDEDKYYAKLRLNDVAGVYLHDWWTPSIMDYNSFNRGSNSQPVIDLGGTVISRDGGSGTPKSAVWQGGRAAFQEFTRTLGAPPPTGDYEIVIQSTPTLRPWTARSTTNYPEGYQTYKFSTGVPTSETDPLFDPYFSQFTNYGTMFHEFGHALRHTIDGDLRHLTDDASRWTYLRGHSLCGSDSGYVDIEAFAFNEGWAEFWAMDTGNLIAINCGSSFDLTDMTKEGAVMNDLHAVAQAISACLPPTANRAEAFRSQRHNLFSVLNRGNNIIHSEGEFRSNAMQQFPGCTLRPLGIGVSASPISIFAGPSLVRSTLVTTLLRDRIDYYRNISSGYSRDLEMATSVAARTRDCKEIPCKTLIAHVIHPTVLRGQIAYSDLIGRSFARRYAELVSKKGKTPDMSASAMERERLYREEFRRSTQKIVLQTLDASSRLLDRYSERDKTGEVLKVASEVRRTARRLRLRTPLNDELFTLLELPTPPGDDRVASGAKPK
jgi:hypothetical protein